MANIIANLSSNMLTEDNINKWISVEQKNNGTKKLIKKNVKAEIKNDSDIFYLNEFDKLFWYFFIIVRSMENYTYNKQHLFEAEQKFKFETIDNIREKKSILKSLKINISNVENNLINDKKMSLLTLYALCAIYDISLIIKHEEIYYDFNFGEEYKYIEIKEKNIGLHLGDISNTIETIKANSFAVDIKKPIRAASFYKLKELYEMAKKLNIDTNCNNRQLKKNDLYELILSKIKKLT